MNFKINLKRKRDLSNLKVFETQWRIHDFIRYTLILQFFSLSHG